MFFSVPLLARGDRHGDAGFAQPSDQPYEKSELSYRICSKKLTVGERNFSSWERFLRFPTRERPSERRATGKSLGTLNDVHFFTVAKNVKERETEREREKASTAEKKKVLNVD